MRVGLAVNSGVLLEDLKAQRAHQPSVQTFRQLELRQGFFQVLSGQQGRSPQTTQFGQIFHRCPPEVNFGCHYVFAEFIAELPITRAR